MTVPTIFATRLNVAISRDTAMISLGVPSGPMEAGQITHEEAFRVLLSHQTLRDMAALLAQKVFELDSMMAASAPKPQPAVEAERRGVLHDNDDVAQSSVQ